MNQISKLSTISARVWNIGKLNHVAIATSDLNGSTGASLPCLRQAFYRDILGAKVSPPTDLPSHGVTTVFIELENTKFELLRPLGENSPIQKFLDKNKNGGTLLF
jgi:methylmalonyl-CoA/ethylmalonyl-CoA epimerase